MGLGRNFNPADLFGLGWRRPGDARRSRSPRRVI